MGRDSRRVSLLSYTGLHHPGSLQFGREEGASLGPAPQEHKFDFLSISCNSKSHMRNDNRLSAALHILLHLAQSEAPVTSESLARAVSANPVVIRRTLAGLRDTGYVRSEKGHGGGWTLSCDLSALTLRDVYVALGSPTLFAMSNRTESPACLVEQAVNASLDRAFEDAGALLLERFGAVTLGQLNDELRSRLASHTHTHELEHLRND